MIRHWFVVLLALGAMSVASGQRAFVPFEVDEAGLWQWVPFEPHPCKACSWDEELCLYCGGAKKVTQDPFVRIPCGQCFTKKTYPCVFCRGKGEVRIQGGSPKGNKCFCCDGKGHFKCSLCRGRKFLGTCKAGRTGIRKADAPALEKLRDALHDAQKRVMYAGKGGTDGKRADHYAAMAGKIRRAVPAARAQARGLRRVLKTMAKSQPYIGHEVRVDQVIAFHRAALDSYIRRNIRLVDLALRRLKHNAELEKDSDG